MKNKRWLYSVLFTVAGAALGFVYYKYSSCTSGSCPITSSPLTSMAYVGLIGWLISGLFRKDGENKCNM